MATRVRGWAIFQNSQLCVAYIAAGEAVAVAVAVVAFVTADVTTTTVTRLLVLLGLFAIFQRISDRIERLRIRVNDSHHIDMTSVWTFAGVVALPPAFAIALAIPVMGWVTRLRHKSGMQYHRPIYAASTVVLACAAGSYIIRYGPDHVWAIPVGAIEAVTLVIAMVVYTCINAGLVGGMLWLKARPLPAGPWLGTVEENTLELATLCLGAMTALVVTVTPWLAGLAVVPMIVLQRGALVKQLEVAATTDRKTGLLNAVAWRQVVVKELSRAEREGSVATMFILDMDRFKAVNDEYGHLAGDAVLKAVANCLKEELRGYDSIGRFGGEEFVAFLPDVDADLADSVTARILERIRSLEVASPADAQSPLHGFSASMGVAVYPQDGNEVQLLLHAADAALYVAKAGGRDQAQFVGSSV